MRGFVAAILFALVTNLRAEKHVIVLGREELTNELVDRLVGKFVGDAFSLWVSKTPDLETATLATTGRLAHYGSAFRQNGPSSKLRETPCGIQVSRSRFPFRSHSSGSGREVVKSVVEVDELATTIKSLEALFQEELKPISKSKKYDRYAERVLQRQAPLLKDGSIMANRVNYTSPLGYRYAREEFWTSPDLSRYSSVVNGKQLVNWMDTVRSRLRAINPLAEYTSRVTKSVQLEPNVLLCMWEIYFYREERLVTVKGESTYELNEGKVVSISEKWGIDDKFSNPADTFLDSIAFQFTRLPTSMNVYSLDGFAPAYLYAAWEALTARRKGTEHTLTHERVKEPLMKLLLGLIVASGPIYTTTLTQIAHALQSFFESNLNNFR